VYNDSNNTGIVYGNGNKSYIVLYNVNKNTHWIPGTLTTKKLNKLPNNIIYIKETPTINLQTHNLNIKSTKFDNKNKINNIEIIPNENHIENNNNEPKISLNVINSLQTIDATSQGHIKIHPNTSLNAKTPTHAESLESTVNKQIKQTNDICTVTDQINSLIKLPITDNEGTPFSISPKLNTIEHNKVVHLLTEYKHIFSTDTSNIKVANVKPCEIKIKLNYKEPKFNAPHRVLPQQRTEIEGQINKLLKANIVKPIISKFAARTF